MTTSHETITDTTYRGHEATISALQSWAEGVQKFCGWLPTRDAKVPSAVEVVDHYFNFVEHVLETQREFIKNLLVATNTAYPVHGADKDYPDKSYPDKDYAAKDTAPKKS